MNLLQVLLNPEREEHQAADRAVVFEAANLLQVGEFQVLAMAAYIEYDELPSGDGRPGTDPEPAFRR